MLGRLPTLAAATLLSLAGTVAAQDLQRAVLAGDDAAVERLLAAGADVATQGDLGTALHVAALMDDVAAARLLLDHSAAIDARTGPGNDTASPRGFLPRPGASIEVKDLSRRTPLVQMGQTTLVELPLGRGADPRAEDKDRGTSLDIAVRRGWLAMATLLLEHGAPVDSIYVNGPLPLVEAAQRGDPAMIDLLMQHGADPNATDDGGNTPLEVATAKGYDEAVMLLRQFGAKH